MHEQTAGGIDVSERRHGIGGSDIGAIAGLSPWKSPLTVWLEKTGRRESCADNAVMRRGRLLEDVLARWYAEEFRTEVEPGGLFVHPAREWQRGNVDRLNPSRKVLLECKSVGRRSAWRWGEPGTDEVPEEHIAQGQWYLALPQFAEYEQIDFPVCLAGDFECFTSARDAALGAALVELGEQFWRDHVLKDVPPAMDGSESAREWLAKRYPRETANLLKANAATEEWARKLRDAKARLAAAEADEGEAANHLKDLIGPAAGVEGDGWKVTWKATKGRPSTDWKAIATELAIPEPVIAQHTKLTPVRMFRATFKGKD